MFCIPEKRPEHSPLSSLEAGTTYSTMTGGGLRVEDEGWWKPVSRVANKLTVWQRSYCRVSWLREEAKNEVLKKKRSF